MSIQSILECVEGRHIIDCFREAIPVINGLYRKEVLS